MYTKQLQCQLRRFPSRSRPYHACLAGSLAPFGPDNGFNGTCASGTSQSPINIPYANVAKTCGVNYGALRTTFGRTVPGSVENTGHSLQVPHRHCAGPAARACLWCLHCRAHGVQAHVFRRLSVSDICSQAGRATSAAVSRQPTRNIV